MASLPRSVRRGSWLVPRSATMLDLIMEGDLVETAKGEFREGTGGGVEGNAVERPSPAR